MKPKPSLILHVGLPKTGTTSIQEALAASFTGAVEAGVWYPNCFPNVAEPFHRFLVEELRTPCDLWTFRRVLDAAREAGVRRVILSVEGISAHHDVLLPAQLEYFGRLTSEWEVSLCFVMRPFKSWIRSMYVQCLISPGLSTERPKSTIEGFFGTSAKFEDFEFAMVRAGFRDQFRLASSLRESFNAEESHIFDYDAIKVGEVVSFLGESGQHYDIRTENASIPFSRSETIRKINQDAESQMIRAILLATLAVIEGVAPRVVVIQVRQLKFRERLLDAFRILLHSRSRNLLRGLCTPTPRSSAWALTLSALVQVVAFGGAALTGPDGTCSRSPFRIFRRFGPGVEETSLISD